VKSANFLGSVARIVASRVVEDLECALPRNRLELAGAALAAGLAQQRPGQPRRRLPAS
jgi:hypothetical protein